MIAARHYVLLPGLNGNAALASELAAARPEHVTLTVLELPIDRPRTYAELAEWVVPRLPAGPVTLLAESFSGPLGVLVAAAAPSVVALILCATFVTPAAPTLLANVPRALLGRIPPRAIVRALLTGGDAELADRVRSALTHVPSAVIASRVGETLRADVRDALRAYAGPLLYLQASHDRLVLSHHAHTIATLAPRTKLVTLDAPHLLLQKRPTEAWQHMEAMAR
jgi:pimeloyl-ACP methyl ester carboxylesterase